MPPRLYPCAKALFRQVLIEQGLLHAIGLSGRQNVYAVDAALIYPATKARKLRKYHIPAPISAEAVPARAK